MKDMHVICIMIKWLKIKEKKPQQMKDKEGQQKTSHANHRTQGNRDNAVPGRNRTKAQPRGRLYQTKVQLGILGHTAREDLLPLVLPTERTTCTPKLWSTYRQAWGNCPHQGGRDGG